MPEKNEHEKGAAAEMIHSEAEAPHGVLTKTLSRQVVMYVPYYGVWRVRIDDVSTKLRCALWIDYWHGLAKCGMSRTNLRNEASISQALLTVRIS